MITKAIATTFIIAFTALLSGCQTARNETVNWEYKVIDVNKTYYKAVEESINRNAVNGWQLDSTMVIPPTDQHPNRCNLIFKKKK
ncbi:DUF4177 domain-containing protein [Pontiellaceae bacterium B1224]|nr:DUF4177 domain-containing protein [Pontiellaceae bacterium B1224]